jgi:peptide deformylase
MSTRSETWRPPGAISKLQRVSEHAIDQAELEPGELEAGLDEPTHPGPTHPQPSQAGLSAEAERDTAAATAAEAEEEELDPEVAARRAAALAHVRKFGDPVLKTRARPVDRFDDALRQEVRRMGELMVDALGVGLAATQVGVLNRVLVYRVHQQSPIAALVNPEIEWTGDEHETLEEGCLSLPGVHVDVERPVYVRVQALNEYGEPFRIEASGLEARVIQHEIDHLDGVLVLDRVSRGQRKEAMRALREAQAA